MSVPSRILVVEDEWLIAEDHVTHLTGAGYGIAGPVPSVVAALDLIAREKVDCAVLDVQLKGESSFVLADALQMRRIPFVFVTGFSPKDLPHRFAEVVVLQKPTSQMELTNTVAAMIIRSMKAFGQALIPDGR